MKETTFGRAIVFRVVLALALAAGMVSLPGGGAKAILCDIVVTNNNDSGAGSLRWAVLCSNDGDTITFAPLMSGQTITLTSGQITITKAIAIDGSSLDSQVTISGNALSRIFNIDIDGDLTLDSLKLINGKADFGGAILNEGALTVYDSTFSNNTATPQVVVLSQKFDNVTAPVLPAGWTTSHTAAIPVDWTTPHTADVLVDWTTTPAQYYSPPNSAFSLDPASAGVNELVSPVFMLSGALPLTFQNRYQLENTFDGAVLEISIEGGAFLDILAAGGSFISGGYNFGPINSVFDNPLAGRSVWTGISGGGQSPIFVTTSVNLPVAAVGHLVQLRWRVGSDWDTGGLGQWIDDVFIGSAISQGGAISGDGYLDIESSTFTGNTADEGGAIYNSTLSAAYVNNSTFSGNTSSGAGGAIYNDNSNDSMIDISYSTFAGNQAGAGRGAVDGYGGGNGILFTNTILLNNTPANCGAGTNYASFDYNITYNSGSDSTCNLTGTHDRINTNPLLGPLADNYGPTQTFALLTGSPAIDPGVNGDTCPDTDQRGIFRPVGTSCDIGAFEYDPVPLVIGSSPVDGANVPFGISSLKVVFNKDMLHDGSPEAADTAANYLLVAPTNTIFDTLTCKGGLKSDDTQVVINSVSYDAATWTATLAVNGGIPLPIGNYKLFVCGTTSNADQSNMKLNYGLSDTTIGFHIVALAGAAPAAVPATGFAPGRMTVLPVQPADKTYTAMGDLWLEIPKLGVQMNIVGVPQANGGWDVSWLGSDAGWLDGSAFPTWAGNSVLTGHVWNADNTVGPFRYINTLWWGDKIIIHAWGAQYVYEVRSISQVGPGSTAAMMKHEELPWVTLVTCRGYDETTNSYKYRVLVRAVLVEVK